MSLLDEDEGLTEYKEKKVSQDVLVICAGRGQGSQKAYTVSRTTWIVVSYIGVHVEPVIQSHELEEGEASLTNVPEPTGINSSIQPSTYHCKYV